MCLILGLFWTSVTLGMLLYYKLDDAAAKDVMLRIKLAPIMLGLSYMTFDQFDGKRDPKPWVWVVIYVAFILCPFEVTLRATIVCRALGLCFISQTLNLVLKTSMCNPA